MGSHVPRRRVSRKSSIETLESRQVFSADPLGGLLGGGIEHHLVEVETPLEQHGEPVVDQAGQEVPAMDLHGETSLVHHTESTADFWYDVDLDPDLDALFGGIEQTLASAHNLTGALQARETYGFTGIGQTIAVIDSGIAYDHYALGGGLGAGYRVVGGWDFTENDANPYDDGPEGSHGTHVAGIIGAVAGTAGDSGVAPGVDLVGLRVFDDAGAGYFSWVEKALRWVHTNRNAYENPITAVNLSLGTQWNSASVPAWAMLEDEFAQLAADGIFVSVSAGNSFATYNTAGLSYPAASSHVVPVMSLDDTGSLSYFSQRHERAIAAPGRTIRSTVPDYAGNHNGVTDDWANFSGTSMAAPYVAGASAIVRQAMEFVGFTNIDQWDIYDHMMATAVDFFDAATNQWYKRLDLKNAIDALIPSDDFGSSVVDAYDLGSLGAGSSNLSGSITTLSDSDYFRFTAGVTGTVTIAATTTHQMAAAWTGGGTATDANTYTFDVVAGQSYTFGLATNDGLGHYSLAIDVESTFTFTDWGTVAQWQSGAMNIDGESWFQVTASQTGFLTAEALVADSGNVQLAWYTTSMQPLSVSIAQTGGARVDRLVSAGEKLYLRALGTDAEVDFRVSNLITVDGNKITVKGTAIRDVFTFEAGPSAHSLTVNGVSYTFAADTYSSFAFNGRSGSDELTITGSQNNELATFRPRKINVIGSGYVAAGANIESITVVGGGGTNDRAEFYDSTSNDVFTTWKNEATMTGSGFENVAQGFRRIAGHATAGGYDHAILYDSTGNDTLKAWPNRATMQGDDYLNIANDFDRIAAHSRTGTDQAFFYDSSGNDVYKTWPNRATMKGDGYLNTAWNFSSNVAYSTSGGADSAFFYDSAGDDLYKAWSNRAWMSGTGYKNVAWGFGSTTAYASTAFDRADLYDAPGDNSLLAAIWGARMSGDTFRNAAVGFDGIVASLNNGNATVDVKAIDYIFDMIGV